MVCGKGLQGIFSEMAFRQSWNPDILCIHCKDYRNAPAFTLLLIWRYTEAPSVVLHGTSNNDTLLVGTESQNIFRSACEQAWTSKRPVNVSSFSLDRQEENPSLLSSGTPRRRDSYVFLSIANCDIHPINQPTACLTSPRESPAQNISFQMCVQT